MSVIIAAVMDFLNKHAAAIFALFGVHQYDKNKQLQAKMNEIKAWDGIDRRTRTRGGIERMRQRSGK